jgi:hypothetical protein
MQRRRSCPVLLVEQVSMVLRNRPGLIRRSALGRIRLSLSKESMGPRTSSGRDGLAA